MRCRLEIIRVLLSQNQGWLWKLLRNRGGHFMDFVPELPEEILRAAIKWNGHLVYAPRKEGLTRQESRTVRTMMKEVRMVLDTDQYMRMVPALLVNPHIFRVEKAGNCWVVEYLPGVPAYERKYARIVALQTAKKQIAKYEPALPKSQRRKAIAERAKRTLTPAKQKEVAEMWKRRAVTARTRVEKNAAWINYYKVSNQAQYTPEERDQIKALAALKGTYKSQLDAARAAQKALYFKKLKGTKEYKELTAKVDAVRPLYEKAFRDLMQLKDSLRKKHETANSSSQTDRDSGDVGEGAVPSV